jgi:hypothetical protein
MSEAQAKNTTLPTAAQHYTFAGKGLSGVLDMSGISGRPVASLTVDGHNVDEPTIREKSVGIVLRGQVSATPDLETVEIQLTIPHVNLPEDVHTFAGIAILTTARTSVAGPRFVEGAVQSYELRPVAGQASQVASLRHG